MFSEQNDSWMVQMFVPAIVERTPDTKHFLTTVHPGCYLTPILHPLLCENRCSQVLTSALFYAPGLSKEGMSLKDYGKTPHLTPVDR